MSTATASPSVTLHARGLVQAGRGAEAIQELMSILQHDTSNAEAYELMGAALSMTGNREQSLACLQRAVELEPNKATYQYNLGAFLENHGDLLHAVEHYRLAFHADPSYKRAEDAMHHAEIELITPKGHHLVERS